jgi:hypothetical protein
LVVFRGQAVSTEECRIFYRTAPLGNGDDRLFKVNLCNVYENGAICTGDMRVQGEGLAQKAEQFVSQFWRVSFNNDLVENCFLPAARKVSQVQTLSTWQKESEKNQLFPLQVKWIEYGGLSEVLEGRC